MKKMKTQNSNLSSKPHQTGDHNTYGRPWGSRSWVPVECRRCQALSIFRTHLLSKDWIPWWHTFHHSVLLLALASQEWWLIWQAFTVGSLLGLYTIHVALSCSAAWCLSWESKICFGMVPSFIRFTWPTHLNWALIMSASQQCSNWLPQEHWGLFVIPNSGCAGYCTSKHAMDCWNFSRPLMCLQ